MKTNLIIIVSLSALFMSCFDIKPKPMKKVLFSDDFRAYTQFEVGSYWVYVDSISDERDTVRLYIKEKDTITFPNSNLCKIEASVDNIKRSFYKDQAPIGTDITCDAYQVYGLSPGAFFFANNVQYSVDTTVKESIVGDKLGNCVYEQYLNNVSILGKTYANIRVFYQDAFTSPTSFVPIRGYWARDIGLIRKETSDGRIWLLESHHIVR
jgi:hypothetical protein